MIKLVNLIKKNKDSHPSEHKIDMTNVPKHIAIIMDGNGRWAKEKNMPRAYGHKAGVEAIRPVVTECSKLGVKYLTLYGFSTENWSRPSEEINTLMKLLVEYLEKEFDELNSNNVVINHIGDISKLPIECQAALNNAYEKTKYNKGLILNLAFNYGGRDEIIHAFKCMYKDLESNEINEDDINETVINRYLYTAGMPDPDIIIRPSGEQRLSNFLLWQCAYSELWYSDIYWPDFNEKYLLKAIADFQNRDRRYGGVKK